MVECKSWKRCHRPSDQTLQKRLNSFLQQKHYSIRRDSPMFLETDPEVIYSLPPDPVAYSFFRKLCSFFSHQEKICSPAISPRWTYKPFIMKDFRCGNRYHDPPPLCCPPHPSTPFSSAAQHHQFPQ